MPISTGARGHIYSSARREPFLFLVTFSSAELAQPIRLVNNTEPVTSRGNVFNPAPMEPRLADQIPDRPPQAQVRITDIGREVVEALRSVQDALTVEVELVVADEPDTVQATLGQALLQKAEYDSVNVSGTLKSASLQEVAAPGKLFTPATTPGLFP